MCSSDLDTETSHKQEQNQRNETHGDKNKAASAAAPFNLPWNMSHTEGTPAFSTKLAKQDRQHQGEQQQELSSRSNIMKLHQGDWKHRRAGEDKPLLGVQESALGTFIMGGKQQTYHPHEMGTQQQQNRDRWPRVATSFLSTPVKSSRHKA